MFGKNKIVKNKIKIGLKSYYFKFLKLNFHNIIKDSSLSKTAKCFKNFLSIQSYLLTPKLFKFL